jgi:light-independent protochlorophyllide reductase subunit B
MMATLGVEVNVVAPWGASLSDLERLPEAWVNIAPYRELGPGAVHFLEERFDTPALLDIPIGVQPTLAWLHRLVDMLNDVGARHGHGETSVTMPPLTAFSLDGLSTPSSVPWFARTADMESFSSKQAFVFGDATHTVGVVRFLHDELGMQIAGAGTYLAEHADWIRYQLSGYLDGEFIVTDRFQQVARQIEDILPDLVCGTQMERHSSRKLDVPCMVIASPTHIENHLLGYYPMLGFDGADVIADTVYTTTKLGLEKHLIDMFGDAGLEYEDRTAGDEHRATVERVATDGDHPEGEHASTNGDGDSHAHTSEDDQAAATKPVWTPGAEAMLKKIPFFVRGRVRKNTEKYAVEHGHLTITEDILREAKEALGG